MYKAATITTQILLIEKGSADVYTPKDLSNLPKVRWRIQLFFPIFSIFLFVFLRLSLLLFHFFLTTFRAIIPSPYQYHSGQLLSIGCHLFSYVFISRFSFFISVVSPSCVITRIYFSPIFIKHLVPCRILFDWVSTALSKMFWTLAWWFRAFGQYHPIGSKLKIWKWEKNQNQKWKRA